MAFAAEDDHFEVPEDLDVVEGVLFADDHVGALAGLDGAGDVIDVDEFRVPFRGGIEGELVGDADVLREVVELAPHAVVVDEGTAGVGAEADGDVVREALFRAVDDAVHDDFTVDAGVVAGVADLLREQAVRSRRRDGADVDRAPLLEETEDLGIRLRAVFDAVDAVLESDTDAFRALDVGGDHHAVLVGFVAGRLDDLRRHLQDAGLADDFRVHDTAGDHQFDEVGLRLHDLPNMLSCHLRGLRFRGKDTGKVAVRDGDAGVRDKEPRADDLALIDLLFHDAVDVRNAADRPQCGDTAEQFLLDVGRLDFDENEPQQRVPVDHLDEGRQRFVVGLLVALRCLAGRRQMRVQVDEAGHDVCAFEVHDLVVFLPDVLRGHDGLDELAVNDDGLPLHRLHVDAAVEDVPVHISSLFHSFFPSFGDVPRRLRTYLLIINRHTTHRN